MNFKSSFSSASAYPVFKNIFIVPIVFDKFASLFMTVWAFTRVNSAVSAIFKFVKLVCKIQNCINDSENTGRIRPLFKKQRQYFNHFVTFLLCFAKNIIKENCGVGKRISSVCTALCLMSGRLFHGILAAPAPFGE